MRKFLVLIAFFCTAHTTAFAAPIQYEIVPDKSTVGFSYQFATNDVMGQFPKYDANISIDFEKAANSQIDVILNAAQAKAGFIFATNALRSKSVLDTKTYPNITFTSNAVKASGKGVTVDGLVTVRGITKPLTLKAKLLRDVGTLASERDDLRIRLSGKLNRHDFGASGFADEVGDILTIKIDAQIKRK
jgi:polyisoprenoid-binding protein YceI